jgi:hypothetical protein
MYVGKESERNCEKSKEFKGNQEEKNNQNLPLTVPGIPE